MSFNRKSPAKPGFFSGPWKFTSIAIPLFKILDNIATPVLVNAYGEAPPKYFLCGITFCDTSSCLAFVPNIGTFDQNPLI